MDLKDAISSELWTKPSSSGNDMSGLENSPFTQLSSQQGHQKWEDVIGLGKGIRVEPPLGKSNLSSNCQSSIAANPGNGTNSLSSQDDRISEILRTSKSGDWDPRAMLNNLSVLEQKIHQLQNLVHTIVGRTSQVSGQQGELVAQQQQLITADLTSIIVQLISTAGSLLPSVKHTLASDPSSIEQLGGVLLSSTPGTGGTKQSQPATGNKVSNVPNQMDQSGICSMEQNYSFEEHELKDDEDADDGETLSPGSYEILQLEKEEILAPHTHFCTICGKGFKRDANLRMHMRGHGDEYKTPAALAKPNKETTTSEPVMIKRYSCPFAGCKRNREHKKFQPLKTILCVKNHYKRTHCDKRFTCSRCNTKKFSVIADLKTHEKHCGKDKWLCSCGTTFSRKDKLFGHIALFQGHTPAIPPDETKGSGPGSSHENFDENGATNKVGGIQFGFDCGAGNGNGIQGMMDMKVDADDPASCYSPLNFDTCNFSGFHEFPRPPFDDSESSFSFLLSGSCNYSHNINGRDSGSDGMQ